MMDVMSNWRQMVDPTVVTSNAGQFGMSPQAAVTDQSPQMMGTAPTGKANASITSKRVLHDSVTLVGVSIVLLYVMGAIVFKGVK